MSTDWDERFRRVIDANGPALRRVAQAYTRDGAETDDLFQDICFAIWRALPSFRGESSERTFAFRIAHNRGLTFRTRRKETAPLDDELRDRSPGPETLLTAALRRERLLAAVRLLPEPQRQVITMSLEGMSAQEIAEVLGVTTNTIAIRLTRARQALRGILRDEGSGA